MVLYFDNNMEKITKNDMIIFYSSFLNYALRVDKETASVIDCLVKNGSGNEIDLSIFHEKLKEFTEKQIDETIEALVDTELFYDNNMSYRLNNFTSIREKYKKIDIKLAYVHLTYKCNLNCEYCYNRDKLNTCKELSLEGMKKVIDTLKENGVDKVVFTGGEPTLYPYFKEIVNYVYDKELNIEVLTNGTTLSKVEQDIINKVNRFIVSLDSMESDKTHRLNSEKYTVLNEIEKINNKGGNVTVRSVLTSKNADEVNRLKNYLNAINIEHIEAIFIPNSKEELYLVPNLEEIKMSNEEYELCNIEECGAGQSTIAIDPEGKVYPCQALMVDEFYITDVSKENWMENIKKSPICQYFLHRRNSDIDGCDKCGVSTLCSGGCRSIAFNVYNDIEHRLDFLCDYLKNESINSLENIRFE
jgi:radical SAM protein with 4Fe4S-binding SPASM domain